MSGKKWIRVRAGALSGRAVMATRAQEPRRGPPLADLQRDAVGRWTLALASRDDAEVDRLVRWSRAERVADATSGRPEVMLGGVDHLAALGDRP